MSRQWTALSCLLVACQPGPAGDDAAGLQQSIVGGAVDTRYAAVVKLSLQGNLECSGSLIGPRTVLTAAHCAVPAGAEGRLLVEIEPGGGAAPLRREVAAQHVHPEWDVRTGAHDLMLLQLNEAVQPVTPLSLYPSPLTLWDIGREVRVVGYGATAGGSAAGIGTRREVVLSVRQVLPLEIEAGASGKQACAGDSGGPALMRLQGGGAEYLAATVSNGDRGCQSTAFYARVDIDVPWIASTASAWDPDCPGAVDLAPPEPPASGEGETPSSGSCGGAARASLVSSAGGVLGLLLLLARRRARLPGAKRSLRRE